MRLRSTIKFWIHVQVLLWKELLFLIAGIFMVELEKFLIPTLTEHMTSWKRYVDNTIAVLKLTSIEHVLSILNNFYQITQFTYELEKNGNVIITFY